MKTLLFLLCFAVSTFAQGAKAFPEKAPVEKIDAQALINDILGRAPNTPSEMMGVLKMRLADGSQRETPIKWMIRPLKDQWQDVYQTPQQGKVPQETLIVVHREGITNHYDLKRNGEAVAGIAENPFVPFATSDFWVADLGLEFLHWPNPKHVDTEMKKGRPCYVIETINPNPEHGYARVLSWLDAKSGGLIRAQAFTKDGALLKEFEIKSVKRVEGRWMLKAIGIRNEQTDTNTRLEFDLEIKE